MTYSRKALTFAVVGGTALVLAGCTTDTADDDGESSGRLTVWMMTGGPGESPVIEDVNDKFAEEYPDMDVKVEIQQWDNIATKITTALASGNGPDIVEMGNTQTALQTYSGGLLDLTEDKASFEDADNWLPGLAEPSVFDDKLYAAPLYGGTKVVMYNKEMFQEAGISEEPKNLDELMEACTVLQSENSDKDNYSGFYMPGQYWFAGAPFVFGAGGELAVDNDGTWEGDMESAESQEGLAAWKDFQNTCSTPSSTGVNTNSPDQDQLFADGQTAMLYVKAWEPAAVIEKNPDLEGKIGYFVMPGYENDSPLPTIVAGSTIGISVATDKPAAAKDWLRVVTGEEFQAKMAQELNLLPVSPNFLPDDGVTEALTVGRDAVAVDHALPVTPGQATLDGERYNEQFFSSIASGEDIAAQAAEYDEHVAEVFNATAGD